MATVDERLQAVEDRTSILATIVAYGYALDYGIADEYAACWTDDARLLWPGREPIEGKPAILDEFAALQRKLSSQGRFQKHLTLSPRIRLVGDRATVESHYVRLDRIDGAPRVGSMGRYLDVLTRCPDGEWRFVERRTENEAVV